MKIIEHPNDEQLSAWLGDLNWLNDDLFLSPFWRDIPWELKDIEWPDDWPDLSEYDS